jgi:hypothetical protein
MLPWTDPEALNPFYQGMENMNFNADRYRVVSLLGAGLAALNHPDGKRTLAHGQEQMDMALDRYVYPESGCWEESHNYCGHTMKNLTPLAKVLRENGLRNFFDDARFARMFQFWCAAHSPKDPDLDNRRVAPPIGDHGSGVGKFIDEYQAALPEFAASKDPEIQKIARQMAWLLAENEAAVPGDVKPERPDLSSRYLQGYGVAMRAFDANDRESYLVLRAEQSWGHHHMDKGSVWFWGRNVRFFGDCAWGGPPGGDYGNEYKQGPAGHSEIEFKGVTNWTLPCKYPAPWIAEDRYERDFDYACARCMYPHNPRLDLEDSSPVALRNGYDRQVMFVKPDLVVVRDNVETTCPTVWRLHSYQPDGTKVSGSRATLTSAHDVTGELEILYPAGVQLSSHDRTEDGQPFGVGKGGTGKRGAGKYDTRSVMLKWEMPRNTSATWVFGVHGASEKAPSCELLDKEGRVVRARLADGREVVVLMNVEPFRFSGEGVEFDGAVGLVIRQGGKTTVHPVRAAVLTSK